MIDTWEQQVDFVRAMPSAAAKILWILFLSGRSLTGKDLQFTCDMAEKTIQNGLDWLQFKGLIQNNGKFHGWSLTAVAHQLPLPFAQINAGHQNALPALHGAATAPTKAGDGESFGDGENRKIYGFLSSSSDLLQDERDQEEKEEETRENRKFYGFVDDGQTATSNNLSPSVRQMLIDAGIGPRSPKLAELLSLGLDADFVSAHVHVWQVRGDEPPGYLITRLENGDAPPACHCPDCQQQAQIPAHLVGIIKR